MFYLFILESIGTSELLLIGLVALIIFGPRKLPELARMLGKARNEFKRTTEDFKQTWIREVDLESDDKQIGKLNTTAPQNTIQKTEVIAMNEVAIPEIEEVNQKELKINHSEKQVETPEQTENRLNDKRDWL
jgi:Tat protein translocase TatB subunit